MTPDEYLSTRVDEQIARLSTNSQGNQHRFRRLRLTEMCLAAGIPVLAAYDVHAGVRAAGRHASRCIMAANDSRWRVVDRMGCAVSYHGPTEGASRRHLVSGVQRAYPATLVMVERRRYRKRPDCAVIAVQIDLDTPGFTYRKWGGEQRCKAGDWLVDNGGDVYTVDRESFARTYRQVGPGRWLKATAVWAEVATSAGTLPTKEGGTHYEPGDYLVFNEPHGGDPYAVSRDKFEGLYEPAE